MKKSHIISALVPVALSGTLSAKALVTVNGTAIDSSTIDDQVKVIRSQNKQAQDSPVLREGLTERQIIVIVVSQEAKRLRLDQSVEFKKAAEQPRTAVAKQGADKRPIFKTERAVFEKDLLGQAFAMHIAKQNPVREKDIRTAYNDPSKFYRGIQEVQLEQIAVRSNEDAQKAIKDLEAKKSLANVLKQYSADEQAKKAGGIARGYVPLKDLEQSTPSLYTAIKDLKKDGFTSVPLPNGNVYSVFYINDRRDIKVPSYEEMKNEIGSELQVPRIDAAIGALMQKADTKPAQQAVRQSSQKT